MNRIKEPVKWGKVLSHLRELHVDASSLQEMHLNHFQTIFKHGEFTAKGLQIYRDIGEIYYWLQVICNPHQLDCWTFIGQTEMMCIFLAH